MALQTFISSLKDEIEDSEEETFLLFSRPIPSHNLGFIDPKASSIDVTISKRDYTIHQSPGLLSSSRAGGTTGAVLWKITPLLADWLPKSPLASLLTTSSSVLELGCGITPLNALALSPLVGSYVLSDQAYVQKIVVKNLAENLPRKGKAHQAHVAFRELDWETDQVVKATSPTGTFDMVLACDCIYNESLVAPLVQTSADACALKREDGDEPCLCVVAQQMRSDDVFQAWLTEFHRRFRVWRLPDDMAPEGLRPDDGFLIHVGILRS
ncbi:putative methyltransferase-domain-containing protein [Emericellopsis atlantica]|uniref:Methyltransferase-domain-containing protein n=1 Tax=Emericellopsis atlantica TaxID=2614577 RepID=A0A9P8CNS2_9HYPO|nr:putative methyltransferase-domain-containing protein [Emericellopsis atlantica]KAG9253380.1 putative methyltransferase-domain-containing protein [Emericellopsis atlantica]